MSGANPAGKLLLVRHGQTRANIDRVWHGHTDTPLTPLGQQQAQRLGGYFRHYLPAIDAIYASPLQRARITAEHIAAAAGLTVTLDPRLVEQGMGEWEGRSFRELRDDLGFFSGLMTDEHHRAPGGESRFEVTVRFVTAVEEFQRQNPGKNIVVVAHGVAIAFALAHWLDGDTARWVDYRVENTAVTALDRVAGTIGFINRTDHL
jgi:broad specificity phosphatase PhoE